MKLELIEQRDGVFDIIDTENKITVDVEVDAKWLAEYLAEKEFTLDNFSKNSRQKLLEAIRDRLWECDYLKRTCIGEKYVN